MKRSERDWVLVRAHYETSGGSEPTGSGGAEGSKEESQKSGASPEDDRFVIPDGINAMSLVEAAHFYHSQLGWAIHPLLAHDKGDPRQRGKKPTHSGWRDHCAADVTSEDIDVVFGKGRRHNLGVVVRPPFVAVDLDSKPDAGASVMAWLESRPELATVPRERTGGGAHLHFLCHDVPEAVLKSKKAPTSQINEAVSAELYVDGLNIVLSPSVHKSGHTYAWEVTGEIPAVGWADLSRWFGFTTPEPKKRGRPAREKPWWSKWQEDLRTLDLVKVMGDLGHLGECLDPDTSKWSVRCPWESEHTGGKSDAPGSDTVIFNQPETMPAFRCLHSHCDGRTAKDLVEWIEEQRPGFVAENCSDLRAWTPGAKTPQGRPRVVLPAIGRTQSEFGAELGAAVAPALDLFTHGDSLVEIKLQRKATGRGEIPGHMLRAVKPLRLVTSIERTVNAGVIPVRAPG